MTADEPITPEPLDPERAPNPDGPTELVETDDGELVERLSFGTATLLLIWLLIVGAGTALLAAWALAALVLNQRLGPGELFGEFGFYVALYGATGPTVLWLTGRAQGHGWQWFVATAIRIGLFMSALTILFGGLVTVVLGNGVTVGILILGIAVLLATLLISILWGLATWAADRWIARARVAT
jgi:hypothetical protein